MTATRVFLVTPHSPEDPSYVARVQTGDPRLPPFFFDMLDDNNVYLVETATVFYIWVGEASLPAALEAAQRLVKQMQKYEKAPTETKVIRPVRSLLCALVLVSNEEVPSFFFFFFLGRTHSS